MSNASKPDGTDPRILQKEGKTVLMASTTRQSKARKYHEPGCDCLDEIKGGPNEIDIAVAKWKGMLPCSNCIGDNNPNKSSLTGPEVDAIRERLVAGESSRDVADDYPYHSTTLRYHATEKQDYEYEVDTETPAVQWVGSRYVWDNA